MRNMRNMRTKENALHRLLDDWIFFTQSDVFSLTEQPNNELFKVQMVLTGSGYELKSVHLRHCGVSL